MRLRHAFPLLMMCLFVVSPSASGATDKLADLQMRFDHETNSVRKAKAFAKLGDEQFAASRAASQARDFAAVGLVMEKYRDNARSAVDALKKEHPDAERQMGGYKQLQMHVHSALREIDETLLVAPDEYKPPLQLVRQDLLDLDDQLLRMLFPNRRPGKGAVPKADPVPPENQP